MDKAPITFTPKNPCRCGYDGTGVHQCHAGRATGQRCSRPGKVFLVPTMGSLSGMQMKFSCAYGCYCDECRKEAGV